MWDDVPHSLHPPFQNYRSVHASRCQLSKEALMMASPLEAQKSRTIILNLFRADLSVLIKTVAISLGACSLEYI